MKEVEYASKGYPERAYAKWLVLNFIWNEVRNLIKPAARRTVFEREWKIQKGYTVYYLWKAIIEVFRAAIDFYRLNRGKGDKAADISTFFRKKNLHIEFAKFWAGSRNKHRTRYEKLIEKFETALNQDND
jgi:hypothetical protein